MPNRIIKESCRTSPELARLTHGSERCFWRLTTLADDQGRFDATPKAILGFCFPLLIGTVKERDIVSWLLELEQAKLIALYTVSGREYGYFLNWSKHQRSYGTKSKHPNPEEGSLRGSAGICGDSPRTPANPRSYPISDIRESRIDIRESIYDIAHAGVSQFEQFWNAYPRKKSKGQAEKAWNALKPDEQLHNRILDAIERAKTSADWVKEGGKYIPYPASWLRAKGWEDDHAPPIALKPKRETYSSKLMEKIQALEEHRG